MARAYELGRAFGKQAGAAWRTPEALGSILSVLRPSFRSVIADARNPSLTRLKWLSTVKQQLTGTAQLPGLAEALPSAGLKLQQMNEFASAPTQVWRGHKSIDPSLTRYPHLYASADPAYASLYGSVSLPGEAVGPNTAAFLSRYPVSPSQEFSWSLRSGDTRPWASWRSADPQGEGAPQSLLRRIFGMFSQRKPVSLTLMRETNVAGLKPDATYLVHNINPGSRFDSANVASIPSGVLRQLGLA